MVFNKSNRKKRHPYAWLAVFGLAAAGGMTLYNKGKRFFKEKMNGMKKVVKEMDLE